jgi:hypothetical protein
MRAKWQRFSQKDTQEQVTTTIRRVPNVASMALVKPLRAVGPADDIVVRVMTKPASQRPAAIAEVFVERLASGTATPGSSPRSPTR